MSDDLSEEELNEIATISRDEYDKLPRYTQKLIEFSPNRWRYDTETNAWRNAWHPDNEEWRLLSEAAEARAVMAILAERKAKAPT